MRTQLGRGLWGPERKAWPGRASPLTHRDVTVKHACMHCVWSFELVQALALLSWPRVRRLYSLCQPHADRFGAECALDPKYIVNFGEEVVRGQPVFALSLVLATLEPMLRSAAGVASWSVRLPLHLAD